MNHVELSERFERMFRESREKKHKSQDFMAKALGVSKKTIQNIEDGTSCLNAKKIVEWFDALDEPILPWIFKLVYPEHKNISVGSEEEVEEALFLLIHSLPLDAKRKLFYILSGNHGSSPLCIIELINAHLQIPLQSRINTASNVITNYTIAEKYEILTQPNDIQPNIDMLKEALDKSVQAVLNHESTYHL